MKAFASLAVTPFIELLLVIDAFIYKFISMLYNVFLIIANRRILTNELYETISSRIYIVVGVVALFIVAYSMLNMVINPEDKSNGGIGIVKRLVIAFVAIFFVPIAFDFLYSFQNAILSRDVIGSIITGEDGSNVTYTGYFNTVIDGEKYYFCDDCTDDDDYSTCDKVLASSVEKDNLIPENTNCNGKDFLITITDPLDVAILNQQVAGNRMARNILKGFITPGKNLDENRYFDEDEIIVSGTSFWTSTQVTTGMIGMVVGCVGVGAAVAITAVPTGGGSLAALGAIGQACIIGGLASGGAAAFATGALNYVNTLDAANLVWGEILELILVEGDFELIIPFSEAIKDGELEYIIILSTFGGLFIVYVMFSFILDLALRVFKLAFFQLLAPVPIFMSILPNNEKMMSNWIKLVMLTYTEVFTRAVCLSGIALFIIEIENLFLSV